MSKKHYQLVGSKLVAIEQEQPAATAENKPAKAKAKPAQAETEPTNQPVDNEALENDSSST